jgi:hypothetical protein
MELDIVSRWSRCNAIARPRLSELGAASATGDGVTKYRGAANMASLN